MTLPVIFGVAGRELRAGERDLFAAHRPFGFILFDRNLDSPPQISRLVESLRDTVETAAPVLIDQEGGRVQRLGPPHAPAYPPARSYGRMAARDVTGAVDAVRTGHARLGRDLVPLGINVNCAPVLDLAVEGGDDVIGDRAFASDPEVVATLGRAALEGLGSAGVVPVVKHIPGHGRAGSDSHVTLPVVNAPANVLHESDFVPFRALRDAPAAMTAHVVYAAVDATLPLTLSRRGIREIVRGSIGFEGLLISDDLCMGALTGKPAQRAVAALAAGCDLVLHCSGSIDEMAAIARTLSPVTEAALARWDRAMSWRPAARWSTERGQPPGGGSSGTGPSRA